MLFRSSVARAAPEIPQCNTLINNKDKPILKNDENRITINVVLASPIDIRTALDMSKIKMKINDKQ